jgi:cytosine/adenosine deaminase-related metal-dependent hydrolase
LLAEARAAAGLATLDAEDLLELCTLGGARTLGIDGETGSLVPGKWGDCTVVRLHESRRGVADQVLASSPGDVLLTYVGGKEVYRSI